MSNDKDTLRNEYPEELIGSGVHGKFAKSYREAHMPLEPACGKLRTSTDRT